jgi:hypothetical protein
VDQSAAVENPHRLPEQNGLSGAFRSVDQKFPCHEKQSKGSKPLAQP